MDVLGLYPESIVTSFVCASRHELVIVLTRSLGNPRSAEHPLASSRWSGTF